MKPLNCLSQKSLTVQMTIFALRFTTFQNRAANVVRNRGKTGLEVVEKLLKQIKVFDSIGLF